MTSFPGSNHSSTSRRIMRRTRGHGHGPITRLMSPSDLGQIVKPFVFLDIFEANRATIQAMANMPIHPHSGVATVTVLSRPCKIHPGAPANRKF